MFRMGGMSNEGIMSGIRPRQNYAETGAVKDYYGDAEKIITERINGQEKYSIKSTPTIIINEKKLEGSANFKNIKKRIEKLI